MQQLGIFITRRRIVVEITHRSSPRSSFGITTPGLRCRLRLAARHRRNGPLGAGAGDGDGGHAAGRPTVAMQRRRAPASSSPRMKSAQMPSMRSIIAAHCASTAWFAGPKRQANAVRLAADVDVMLQSFGLFSRSVRLQTDARPFAPRLNRAGCLPWKTAKAAPARGRPFAKGNGGRKLGSRNKTTQIAAALVEGEAEELLRKAKGLDLAGDVTMPKFLLGRILPRDRAIKIDLTRAVEPVTALWASSVRWPREKCRQAKEPPYLP